MVVYRRLISNRNDRREKMKMKIIEKVGRLMGQKAYGENDFSKVRPLMRAAAKLPDVYIEMRDFITNVSCTVKVKEKEIFTFTYFGDIFDFIEYEIYPYFTMYGYIE